MDMPKPPLHGIINLNKPAGMTSQDAVTRVKRLLGVKKAGHTGTLDPLATGVLPICLNEATKITGFLLEMDKDYLVRGKLGQRTDTLDCEGRIVETADFSGITPDELIRAVLSFRGRITQTPPMYSAIKVNGKKLYDLARRGIEIERPARSVEIYRIEVLGLDLPFFDFVVSCSKGTYVRTLCDDIGRKLGCGAHVVGLERIRTGNFEIGKSISLDDLENGAHEQNDAFHSIDAALSGLREVGLGSYESERAKNGVQITLSDCGFSENEFLRLKDPDGLLFGIGRVQGNIIRIERILHI